MEGRPGITLSKTAREGTAWALLFAVAGAMLAGMLLFAGSAWAQDGGCEPTCQPPPVVPPDQPPGNANGNGNGNGNANGNGNGAGGGGDGDTIIWFWAGYPFPGML
jgi:hypothetical protein